MSVAPGDVSSRAGAPGFRWQAWAIPVSVALVAFAVYANTLGNGFALDDEPLIRDNVFIRNIHNLGRFFGMEYWASIYSAGLYRPLVTATFALNHAVGGLDPFGYHLVNVLLHAANCALVVAVLLRLTGDRRVAGACALLFAVHAVHTEAVANVAGGRAELLSGFFFLLAWWAHVARWGASGRASTRLYAAGLVAYLGVLLAKESAITFLGVVLLTDWVYADRSGPPTFARLWRLVRERFEGVYAGYLMVTVAYLGARFLVLGFGVSLPDIPEIDNPLVVLSFPWRALNALGVGFQYLSLLIFPLHLSYDYSWEQIRLVRSLDDLRWVGWALGGAAGLAALLWSLRRAPQLFFALGFFLITFSVVSNVPVTIGTILGERLLYMPSLGFCLALSLLLGRLAEAVPGSARLRAACFLIPLAILVGAHAARTVVRNADWESTPVLFLHDAEVVPGSLKARSNAGAALYRMDRPADALEHFERAIERCPSPLFFQSPYNGKVFSLLALERYAEAADAYQVLLQHGLHLPAAEAALALWRGGQGER